MDVDKKTGINLKVLEELKEIACRCDVNRVVLFGSRARGDFKPTSDIDLAVEGGNYALFALEADDATSTLLKYDIVNLSGNVQKELLDSISREGVTIYEKI